MKAEHRHELKTNELADLIAHFPQWVRKNVVTISVVAGVIIALLAVYMWRNLQDRSEAKAQFQLTSLATSVSANIDKVVKAQSTGKDLSFLLIQPADGLLSFAQTAKDNEMAALAWIKRAEAVRAELHYRMSAVTQQDVADQIGKAAECYKMAIEKAPANHTYVSMATYGQGLCAEELGDFDRARELYQQIVDNPDFEPTVARARAEYRLRIVDEYRQKTTFKPAPASAKTPVAPQLDLLDSLGPLDANIPIIDINPPTESNESPAGQTPSAIEPADAGTSADSPTVAEDSNQATAPETPDNAVVTPDANASGQ